jgi:S2P endopeptidase
MEDSVLRIQLESAKKNRENVILWAGDRLSVWEDVQVGTRAPRLAGSLTRWITLFFEYVAASDCQSGHSDMCRYLSTIALSLFFFNLLPLPHADGSHMLKALMGMMLSRNRADANIDQKPFQATLSSPARGSQPRINTPTLGQLEEFELSDDEDGYGAEEGGRKGVREERWKTRLRKAIEAGMVALVLGWTGGWVMLALLRSS